MHPEATATYVTSAFAFLSTLILALIGYGIKAQLEAIRVNTQSQLEALRGEFHLALSASEVRFFALINGKYLSRELFDSKLAAAMLEASKAELVKTVADLRAAGR
jgi:hypothetical protein